MWKQVFIPVRSLILPRHNASSYNPSPNYVTNIRNIKPSYSINENARFRLFARKKDWSPNNYTVASQNIDTSIVDNVYYKIVRANDNWIVADYGTGSTNHTRLSYDVSGSYFDFDMGMLEAGFTYQIKFTYLINGSYVEQPENFRFRIV